MQWLTDVNAVFHCVDAHILAHLLFVVRAEKDMGKAIENKQN